MSSSSTRAFLHLGLGALLSIAAACGSGTQEVQASIGPEGGSLSLPSPAVRFDIPSGALTTTTRVSLRASADSRSVLVTLEPAQLGLSRSGQLSVSVEGPRHISGVTEVTFRGEQPIGVDVRRESSSGASARLRLDRLTQVRVTTMDGTDGGAIPGACREHEEERDGDDDHEGEHRDGGVDGDGHDGEHHDGGVDDDDHEGEHHDGGVLGSMACPDGFECDDGVCVAPGGNHEGEGECPGADGGRCPDDDDHDEHGEEHPDGGHP